MLTWQIDRFLRSGPLCALITLVIPVALAFTVNGISDVDNVLGILLIASGIIFIGSLSGSMVTSGLGSLLFGLGAVLAEVSAFVLLAVGIALFATLIIHDLSGSFRRAPTINRGVWMNAAVSIAFVAVAASAAFTLSHIVGNLATWKAIVVPFGIAGVGFAVKLAADSHVAESRQLTAKRRQADSGSDSSN